jgi:RNA polymerase sigma-70 factor, ECF subfamily
MGPAPATAVRASPQFEQLFASEIDYVAGTLRRLGVAERDVEDLCHDAFLVVHKKLGEYDPSRPLRPWIFGITYRVAVGYKRLFRHRFETAEADQTDAPSPDVAAQIEARDLVLRALAGVPLDRRAIFVLHDVDGQAAPEVARALDVPLNTVYSRLRIARQEFKEQVARFAREGAGALSPGGEA